jgi:SAM-dependent methyltransferase
MDAAGFDREGVFNDDYLYFYQRFLTPERSAEEAGIIWRLLRLEPGMEVLDLACGHGRIANELAALGARVTGLDATPRFLDLARRDAAERGVAVDYVEGDMRRLPWHDRFDAVVSWFTSFGYFDDGDNRTVLAAAFSALKPGGSLLVETMNKDRLLQTFQPFLVDERDGDYMIDRNRYEPLTGRIVSDRVIVRDGIVRNAPFFVRLFSYTELAGWLHEAGFADVAGYGRDEQPLTLNSNRMIVVGERR